MNHFPFIFWSYAGAGLLVLALIARAWWQARQVRRRLQDLEARGIRRRSEGRPE